MNDRLHRPTDVARHLGVSVNTLRRWEREGRIQSVRTRGNHRRFFEGAFTDPVPSPAGASGTTRQRYAYCRVSSSKQKDDLERQIQSAQEAHPNHTIITDIGSGLNFKRKGLLRMVEHVMQGGVEEIVVSHKDRLCRFAFELLEWICRKHDTALVVKDHDIRSAEQELSEDLMAIVHVFSCRHHGMRRYTATRPGAENPHPSDPGARPDTAGMDEGGPGHLQQGAATGERWQGPADASSQEAGGDAPSRGQ